MSADETAATLKYSEYIVKVNDKFPVLKDKSLIKSSQLPEISVENMQFVYRGNPKSDDSRIYTNMRIIHKEYKQIVLGDLRCELEELEILFRFAKSATSLCS